MKSSTFSFKMLQVRDSFQVLYTIPMSYKILIYIIKILGKLMGKNLTQVKILQSITIKFKFALLPLFHLKNCLKLFT